MLHANYPYLQFPTLYAISLIFALAFDSAGSDAGNESTLEGQKERQHWQRDKGSKGKLRPEKKRVREPDLPPQCGSTPL
jgi:hypothetical protein